MLVVGWLCCIEQQCRGGSALFCSALVAVAAARRPRSVSLDTRHAKSQMQNTHEHGNDPPEHQRRRGGVWHVKSLRPEAVVDSDETLSRSGRVCELGNNETLQEAREAVRAEWAVKCGMGRAYESDVLRCALGRLN